ncbi:probable MVD1-mevalonate pyrophosphate decarboxylase [Serendipita indica DSM 11827]|uniref:Diphosphomevalonate decarboxylase n=1 Tax=Serendipita indica (strain DSM 11827) TaxID=1109443 RepID=G4T8G5_SERID|nr:probable MVD1-mevalonate pyrophosphate decarboxylase [Serendipita indica DSM 11827]
MSTYQATVSAPVNIACIKYWGKRDTKLILPTNSSLSVTLDQDHLRSTTSARCDPGFEKDALWLNGKEDEIKPGGRLATCITEMKKLRKEYEDQNPNEPKISGYSVRIASENNFPTAAGLASSASGFAALVYALATLYKLPSSPSQLSLIARQGSGSACRSLFGGFVAWEMGTSVTGTDSFAVQVAPAEHWSDMHALICVVSDAKKGTSSTSGMQRTVETSELLQWRIKEVVPKRMKEMQKAILDKDFDTFATITMRDSNQFHAVALDTDPPIFYMNDTSRAIVAMVTELNRVSVENGGGLKAAYTYDAGPNAVIYAREKDMKEIVNMVCHYFPLLASTQPYEDRFKLFSAGEKVGEMPLPAGFNEGVAKVANDAASSVSRLIHTRVGGGPRVLDDSKEGLLDAQGVPRKLVA